MLNFYNYKTNQDEKKTITESKLEELMEEYHFELSQDQSHEERKKNQLSKYMPLTLPQRLKGDGCKQTRWWRELTQPQVSGCDRVLERVRTRRVLDAVEGGGNGDGDGSVRESSRIGARVRTVQGAVKSEGDGDIDM